MTEHFTQIVGADEAVRMVCQRLARFAVPLKLPPMQRAPNLRRVGDVEIWFDPANAGVARFHLVTKDDAEVDVEVDFSKLSSDYLEGMVAGVQSSLCEHRAKRRGMSVVR